jgi:hypothetical protein
MKGLEGWNEAAVQGTRHMAQEENIRKICLTVKGYITTVLRNFKRCHHAGIEV